MAIKRSRAWEAKNKEAIKRAHKKWRDNNPEKDKAAKIAWRKNNPHKVTELARAHRFRRYGITEAQYHEMLEAQGYSCAICEFFYNEDELHIDHDHTTKQVRAILCRGCNVALGAIKENVDVLKRMIHYIETHKFKP